MSDFDPKKLIDLDECVLNALTLFVSPETKLPKFDWGKFKRPLVVGSGNAIATGRIIFDRQDAVFADEGTYRGKLEDIEAIDGVFLFSASGGKHAPIIAKDLKEKGYEVILLTCNSNALAKEITDETLVFPSIPEPYTYNTSTYMGMVLAGTSDDPKLDAQKALKYIQDVVDPILSEFGKIGDFDAYYLLVPEEFELIRIMLVTKFVELFGRRIARDVFTWEQSKHATTVVNADNELFLAFGEENTTFGKDRLNIPLPDCSSYPVIMAVGYYVIGKIQAQKPAWFKEGIESFAERASKVFGQTIKPIVQFD